MCACSPESQLHPWLHQEKCDKQVKEGGSAPLLWSTVSSSGPTTQDGHGAVGVGPEEGLEDDQRARAPPYKDSSA